MVIGDVLSRSDTVSHQQALYNIKVVRSLSSLASLFSPGFMRQVVRQVIPKRWRHRSSIIKGDAIGDTPFDRETVDRWFTATTTMDS
ncbi:MAG: hypothetical protein VKO26_00980, partial [Cyanobacteriota bacterium]|nr:hypothetical protein [Cyanobacteriota bacterium]